MRTILCQLEKQRDSLPAPDAGGADAAAGTPAPHLVEQVRRDPRAGSRERMAYRDRAAVHVRAIARQPQLLLHREVLRRERLVDLEQLEVGELCFMPLQRPPDRGRRPDAHDRRIAAGDPPADELAERLQSLPLAELARREHPPARPVAVPPGAPR